MDLDDVVWALRNHREPGDVRRHELTNEEWSRVAPLLPRRATRRGRPRPEREQLDYLEATDLQLGLLNNFGAAGLKDGVRRVVRS